MLTAAKRRAGGRARRGAAAACGLAAGALLAGRCYVRTAAVAHGDFALPGLRAAAEVDWDAHDVPSVRAGSRADAYRALGFLHARDRLWQMDMLRRAGRGRMSEVYGADLVETDRFLRTLGVARAAERDEALLDPDDRALLAAYAEGVNAWLAARPGALPPEFLALRYEPEPWAVGDSLAVAKLMAWNQAAWDAELKFRRALDAVAPELGPDLAPDYPAWGPRTVPSVSSVAPPAPPAGPGGRADEPARPGGRADEPARPPTAAGLAAFEMPAGARALLAHGSMATASNAWVVSGARTRSGKPLLANDTHLENQAPSLWYLAALHAPGLEVCGLTLPGLPYVLLGRTRAVAWGFTASLVDDVDFFEERLTASGARYLAPEGERPLETRVETIGVRGAEPVRHVVRATHHGPLLSDVETRAGGRALAMRWTALDPGRTVAGMRAMNEAETVERFLEGLGQFVAPTLNVLYAGADGTIGYHLAGRVPVRRRGDGLLPAPGWSGEFDWTRYLSFDELPSARDPAEGYLVSSNNRIAGDDYPHLLTRRWSEPYRAQRSAELLRDRRDYTAADAAAQQLDRLDRHATRVLPHAVRAAELAGDPAAAAALRAWDGEARADSHAAALFYVWFERLRRGLAEDDFRGQPVFLPTVTLDELLERGGGRWADDARTAEVETLDQQLAAAMRDAARDVGTKTWGALLTTTIPHPLGVSALLQPLLGVSLGPYPTGGSNHTLNVAGYEDAVERPGPLVWPLSSSFGASDRFVVDLGDPDGPSNGFVLQTGQSGVPFSPHYRDQTPLWLGGGLLPLPLDAERFRARAVAHERLSPRASPTPAAPPGGPPDAPPPARTP